MKKDRLVDFGSLFDFVHDRSFRSIQCQFLSFDCVNELFPGGVKIDAEKSLDLDGVYINKGEQVMDGNTLLQYARFREDKEGDFGRIRRQQQVIKAISQQLKDVTSIFKLPKAVGKLLGSIQTNLPESVLLDCGMDFLKDIC